VRPSFISVTCFHVDGIQPPCHFAIRLTKTGRANKTDVNVYLGNAFKVPIRYTSWGIRVLNPDVGWPEHVLWQGDPPEEYSCFTPDGDALNRLRQETLKHHPDKMTPEERAWIGRLEARRASGTNSEKDLKDREAFHRDLESRPLDIDEW